MAIMSQAQAFANYASSTVKSAQALQLLSVLNALTI